MPDEPKSDSSTTGSREHDKQAGHYLVDVNIPPYPPPNYRIYFEKWLKRNREPVVTGDALARITAASSEGEDDSQTDLLAPASGVFVRSESLKPGARLFHITPVAHVMVLTPPGYEQALTVLRATEQIIRDRFASEPVREPPAEIRAAMTEPTADSHGVFISYRRSDQAAFAGRLYDHLVHAFNKSTVFMDVDSIELGLDFTDVLHEALERCRVVIAVIGRDWLTAADEAGALRLDDPDDFVRLEIETALERGLRLIPVLVDGAPMPRSTSLPGSMAKLARRNGRKVSNARFGSDTIELINTLRRLLDD